VRCASLSRVLPHHSDPRALRALWSERLATELRGLSWASGGDQAGRRANADANNRSGHPWTRVD